MSRVFFREALGRPKSKVENFAYVAQREHAAPGDGRFERFAFEPFSEQISHAHRQDAQKLVHLLFAQTVKFPSSLD